MNKILENSMDNSYLFVIQEGDSVFKYLGRVIDGDENFFELMPYKDVTETPDVHLRGIAKKLTEEVNENDDCYTYTEEPLLIGRKFITRRISFYDL